MVKIYIDSDYKCHVSNDGTMQAVETDFFGEKCQEYIEGYRFVPSGKTWTREDGTVFVGEMICPFRDYTTLSEIQAAVDRTQDAADKELAELIEEIYTEDLEAFN